MFIDLIIKVNQKMSGDDGVYRLLLGVVGANLEAMVGIAHNRPVGEAPLALYQTVERGVSGGLRTLDGYLAEHHKEEPTPHYDVDRTIVSILIGSKYALRSLGAVNASRRDSINTMNPDQYRQYVSDVKAVIEDLKVMVDSVRPENPRN